ncbi:hypothetical protein C8Q76DRAFT_697871 [Earliella scabrosa]|nr:hypothetical protein C8Q76DRAFT_697871 [Earliella scabrosa]
MSTIAWNPRSGVLSLPDGLAPRAKSPSSFHSPSIQIRAQLSRTRRALRPSLHPRCFPRSKLRNLLNRSSLMQWPLTHMPPRLRLDLKHEPKLSIIRIAPTTPLPGHHRPSRGWTIVARISFPFPQFRQMSHSVAFEGTLPRRSGVRLGPTASRRPSVETSAGAMLVRVSIGNGPRALAAAHLLACPARVVRFGGFEECRMTVRAYEGHELRYAKQGQHTRTTNIMSAGSRKTSTRLTRSSPLRAKSEELACAWMTSSSQVRLGLPIVDPQRGGWPSLGLKSSAERRPLGWRWAQESAPPVHTPLAQSHSCPFVVLTADRTDYGAFCRPGPSRTRLHVYTDFAQGAACGSSGGRGGAIVDGTTECAGAVLSVRYARLHALSYAYMRLSRPRTAQIAAGDRDGLQAVVSGFAAADRGRCVHSARTRDRGDFSMSTLGFCSAPEQRARARLSMRGSCRWSALFSPVVVGACVGRVSRAVSRAFSRAEDNVADRPRPLQLALGARMHVGEDISAAVGWSYVHLYVERRSLIRRTRHCDSESGRRRVF